MNFPSFPFQSEPPPGDKPAVRVLRQAGQRRPPGCHLLPRQPLGQYDGGVQGRDIFYGLTLDKKSKTVKNFK